MVLYNSLAKSETRSTGETFGREVVWLNWSQRTRSVRGLSSSLEKRRVSGAEEPRAEAETQVCGMLKSLYSIPAAAASGGLPLIGGNEHDSPLSLVSKGGLSSEAMSSPLSLVKHLQQQMQYPLANHLHIGAPLDNDDSLRREISASPESGLSSKFEQDPEALSLVKKAGSRMQDINDNNERQKEQILPVAEVKQEVDDQLSSAEVAQ